MPASASCRHSCCCCLQRASSPPLSRTLQDLYDRCVSYDRAQRPSFLQILDLLAPLVECAEAEAPEPPPSPTKLGGLAPLRSASFRALGQWAGPLPGDAVLGI